MITHKIEKTPSNTGSYPVVTAPASRQFKNGDWRPTNQEQFDEYRKRYPWIDVGRIITYDHNHYITGAFSCHLVTEIHTDWSKVTKPPIYNGRVDHPKFFKALCLNLTKGVDNDVVSSWERWDTVTHWRELTKEEYEKWIKNNDYLQDCLKLWKEKRGWDAPIIEPTNTWIQGTSVPASSS